MKHTVPLETTLQDINRELAMKGEAYIYEQLLRLEAHGYGPNDVVVEASDIEFVSREMNPFSKEFPQIKAVQTFTMRLKTDEEKAFEKQEQNVAIGKAFGKTFDQDEDEIYTKSTYQRGSAGEDNTWA